MRQTEWRVSTTSPAVLYDGQSKLAKTLYTFLIFLRGKRCCRILLLVCTVCRRPNLKVQYLSLCYHVVIFAICKYGAINYKNTKWGKSRAIDIFTSTENLARLFYCCRY